MTTTELKHGLALGSPVIRSVGPITFGPDGVLFIADNATATIVAVDTRDEDEGAAQPLVVDELDARLAAYLGCDRADVLIKSMAVHPATHNTYLSVMRGAGDVAVPVIVKVSRDGSLSELALRDVPFAQVTITDAPASDDERTDWRRVQGNREGELTTRRDGTTSMVTHDQFRTITITDMQYLPRKADWNVHGQLLVAGVSNEEFSSVFRRVAFPFRRAIQQTAVEVYHVNHGQYETISPIRTFVPYENNTAIIASYTCTPLVHFTLDDLKPGAQVTGRTIGELGGWSTPVDMLTYSRDGDEYLLVANSGLPLMKIAIRDIEAQSALNAPREPEGVARTELHHGVAQMARLGDEHVLMLEVADDGVTALRTYSVDSL